MVQDCERLQALDQSAGERSERLQHWCVTVDGRVAGSVGLEPSHDPGRSHVRVLGYWVAPRFQRRGAASAAVDALIATLPRGTRVEAHIFTGNEASAGVLRKSGFACFARAVDGYYVKGEMRLSADLFAREVQ